MPVISTSPPCARSSRPQMCKSVDLPAPEGATIATSSPPLTTSSAASSTRTSVSPLPKCRCTAESLRCGSLIPQRLDRIVLGGAPGRIDRREERKTEGKRGDADDFANLDPRGKSREEEDLGREDADADEIGDEGTQRLGVERNRNAKDEPDDGACHP